MGLETELKLPEWDDFFSHNLDYYSDIARQDLLCRFKLKQIYQNFCIGRMNCIFSQDNTNYGDLDPEGRNKRWLKKLFLQNALLYYNTCVDLSWCLIYFYYAPKKVGEFNITKEEIEQIEKEISFENLQQLLNSQVNLVNASEQAILEQLIEITNEFWNNKMPEGFRQDYNYIKHKGTFDIFDMEQTDVQSFIVNGKEPDIVVPRFKEFNSKKYLNMLIEFHNVFNEYIDKIIEIIIKPKYREPKYSFDEIANNVLSNSRIKKKYHNNFN